MAWRWKLASKIVPCSPASALLWCTSHPRCALRKWGQKKDRLVNVLPKETNMPINGTDWKRIVEFRQSDDAGIRKIHWRIGVPIQQISDGIQFVGQRNRSQSYARDEFDDTC